MKITRATAREIADKVVAFTNSLEAEYGIKVDKNSTVYTDTTVKITLNTAITEENREDGSVTPAESQYDREARFQNLPARGTKFTNDYGEEFTIKEWIPRGRKYKILGVKTDNGKRYKFTVTNIQYYITK